MSLDGQAFAELQELLDDAASCSRLSNWEQEFLDSMRDRVERYGVNVLVSDKQWAVIERIQAKIYSYR